MLCKRISKLICCLAAVNFVMDVYSVTPGPWTISVYLVHGPLRGLGPWWTTPVDYPQYLKMNFHQRSELILGTLKAKGMKVCQFLVYYQD